MNRTTSLNIQDFQNFIRMNNDVYSRFEEEFIDNFGNQEEDIDELNNWVHEKSKEYLTEYFEEINKELYSKEQLEEIKHLLGI